jgi:hypothetical protein
MTSLLFCRDGILRLRTDVYDRAERKGYPIFLPLTEMEDRVPGMFLSLLGADIELEDGLDVREALLNLAPWSQQVSAICSCRFNLFLEEARKPLAKDHCEDLEILAFRYMAEISAEPKFEHEGENDELFERIPGSRNYRMRDSRPLVTDRLEIGTGRWDCAGFKPGTEDWFERAEDSGYSMSLSPLTRWHHLKLKVIDHFWLMDRTVGSDFVSHKGGLLAASHPLGEEVMHDGRIVARRVRVQAPRPTLYPVLLMGLVWEIGFHGSPAQTAEIAAELRDQVDKLDEADHSSSDPARLAETEARIAAELAEEEARKEADRRANPFDEDDLRTLEIARAVAQRDPKLVRAPEGLPAMGRGHLRVV